VRRYAVILMVALVAVALIASGCGSKKSDDSSSAASVSMSAQEILDKTMAASADMKSATGTMNAELNVELGPSASADPSTAMFSQGPIKISGDISASTEPMAGDATMNLSLGGQALQFGVKYVDDQAYIDYMGSWYDAPPEVEKQITKQQEQQSSSADVLGELKKLGVDPVTWASSMEVVGTEQIAGVETYHIKLTVDTAKMITDVMKLAQSPEVAGALGDSASGLGDASGLTDADLAQIKQIFKSASIDIWSQTDTFYLRKMAMAAEIVPPPDEAGGISSMGVSADFVYNTINEPVTVEAPTDAKPWKELQPSLDSLGSMLGGSI
jgi:hypothetical protein